eukprot:800816-Pelagomonas_calceolata.AAC.5
MASRPHRFTDTVSGKVPAGTCGRPQMMHACAHTQTHSSSLNTKQVKTPWEHPRVWAQGHEGTLYVGTGAVTLERRGTDAQQDIHGNNVGIGAVMFGHRGADVQ